MRNPHRKGLRERDALLLILEYLLGRAVRLVLKTSDRHEEAQHLGGKWIPGSQLFGSRNAPLAQGLRHGSDYQPRGFGSQCNTAGHLIILRSRWNQVRSPTYQGAVTAKTRSLPRTRSTHSRSRPR